MRIVVTAVAYAAGALVVAYLLDWGFASFFFHDVGRVIFPVLFAGGGAVVGVLHGVLRNRDRVGTATVALPVLVLVGMVLVFWKESRRFRPSTADYGPGAVEGYRPQPPW